MRKQGKIWYLHSCLSPFKVLKNFLQYCHEQFRRNVTMLHSVTAMCSIIAERFRANNRARHSYHYDRWCRVVVADSGQSTPTPVNKQMFVLKKKSSFGSVCVATVPPKVGDTRMQCNTHPLGSGCGSMSSCMHTE